MTYLIEIRIGPRELDVTDEFLEGFNPHPGSMITVYDATVKVQRVDFIVKGRRRETIITCEEIS